MKRPSKQTKPTRAAKSPALREPKVLPREQRDERVNVSSLYRHVREILEEARNHTARHVNSEMVRAYWLIGQAIVEHEQKGRQRAGYGKRVIEALAERLTVEFGKGFSKNNLWYMRQFYLAYPEKLHALRGELSWTHYRLLLKVAKPEARQFYEAEAAAGNWSTRQLERQIHSLFYERLLLSKDKRGMLEQNAAAAEKYDARDFVKDPYVLEFLGLKSDPSLTEAKLEAALLDHLQEFLLELGKGFAFVARQYRITIDGDHFYVDLVFYNRLLRCFVLIDLKLGKLTHQDIGQMQFYTNYFTRELREEWENPAIGLLLCEEKNETVVRYTLPEEQRQIFAAEYRLYLPSEEELAAELQRQHALWLRQRELEK